MNLKNRVSNYPEKRIAILIDSENVSSSKIEFIIKESIKYGLLTIRRIYGDWTSNLLSSWKQVLPVYAIQPMQQFRNTSGKNSTDSAMIIDAMDILYSGHVDGFIIVSSDSDYTKLSVRLRESGKIVIGIGEKKTPLSLINACNEFKFIENLEKNYNDIIIETKEKINNENNKEKKDEVLAILIESYEMIDQESEWKNLSSIAHNLKKLDPSFDPKSYGFSKLSKLILKYDKHFELKWDNKTIFVNKK
ncbi:MAG TPA: NYN domain-containing protein [Spirochaetota bacterium]|nr:NYN domain-containing protein [Spirochaetota bacterium]